MIANIRQIKLVKASLAGMLLALAVVVAVALVWVNVIHAAEVIVDDLDAGYSDTGWSISGSGPYHFAVAGDGSEVATWTPTVPTTGMYEVFISWYAHPNRATNAPYAVYYSGGVQVIDINQQQLADGSSVGTVTPSGWYSLGEYQFLAGTSGQIVLTNDADGYVIADQIRLVEVETGSISGTVYEDLNGDGVKDVGEAGLENWKVRLRDPNNGNIIIATATTDADGNYTFENVAAGDYRINETLKAGYDRTSPVSPNRYDLTLAEGETATGYDFGNFAYATLEGVKYEDLDGNGTQDAGEPGVAGWEISLYEGLSLIATTTTDLSGAYSFTGVGAGTFTVEEAAVLGWVQTAPVGGVYTVTPESGEIVSGLDFGNRQTNMIEAFKYEDRDADGIYNDGDQPIENWQINLYDDLGNLLDFALTNASGTAVFMDLDAGDYLVEEETQPTWYASTPTSTAVTLLGNGDAESVSFGNYQLGTIQGKVYEDLNGNAVKDGGEPVLSGWIVGISLDGMTLGTTTSDGNGFYQFADLEPGVYDVFEAVQGGWKQTGPVGGTYTVTVKSGQVKAGRHFGNQRVSGISGMSYNDHNGNGIKDEGENGVAGFTIRLRNLDTNAVIATTTDAYGYYSFNDIASGNYRVSEKQEDGWLITNSPQKYNLTVTAGDFYTDIDFGNFLLGEIYGVKYEDVNGSGFYDASGDVLLPGWEIQLLDGNGSILATTTTDVNGEFSFTGLEIGDYALQEVMQSGWEQSEPGPATNYQHEFSIEQSGTVGTDANFGNYRPATMIGFKYLDENLNGVKDAGEPGLSGWTIEATHLTTGNTYTDVTNANGKFKFENLRPGPYLVKEVVQDGWLFTDGPIKQVTLESNQTVNNVYFGNNEVEAFFPVYSPFALTSGPSLGGPQPLSTQTAGPAPEETVQTEVTPINSYSETVNTSLNMPEITIPKVEIPTFEMPKFEMPSFGSFSGFGRR